MKTKVISMFLVLLFLIPLLPVQSAVAAGEPTVTRIAGGNRYETTVEISKAGWTKSDYVVLARGDGFADALAGVPLAYALDAPILLTKPGSLSSATRTELIRLGAKTVIILGGTGAVSLAVENILNNELGVTVDRIAGADRYSTAGLIAERLRSAGAYNDKVIVANGRNFPDALAASAYAARLGYPIILIESNKIPSGSQAALDALNPTASYVVGGVGAVSGGVFAELINPERIAGSNRYATATALAEHFQPGSNSYYVATGLGFADAIAGGVLAAKEDAALLLVSGTSVPPAVRNYLRDNSATSAFIFGGTGAVSEGTVAGIKGIFAHLEYTDEGYFTFKPATGTITGYDPAGGLNVLIPPTIGGVAVKHIGDKAFFCKHLTSVVIPDSIITIGKDAFSWNELTSVVIGNSVKTIGVCAFERNKLTSVVIPDSVITIGDYAFGVNELASVVIGNSVKTIGNGAFSGNALTSVVIPDSVITIGDSVFFWSELTSVIIGDSVETIGDSAFSGNALTSVVIPDSVKTIGYGAFSNNQLTNVVIGSSVETIGGSAFSGNALTSVMIPDSVITIDMYAFYNNALTSVGIGNSVKTIGMIAFAENALTSVVIPDSVIIIGEFAFARNAFTSITIGSGVSLEEFMLSHTNNFFRQAYYIGGAGTYAGTQEGSWIKQ
jgi:putative cell wall-binding protein